MSINKRRVYACYQCDPEHFDETYIEFWSMNKALYDTYCSIYTDTLDPERYTHLVLPISELSKFRSRKNIVHELVVLEPPNEYHFKNPIITTDDNLSILDPAEVLVEYLGLMDSASMHVERLPFQLRAAIMHTKYWSVMNSDDQNISWQDSLLEMLDVDYDRLFYLAQTVYYSQKDILEIMGVNIDMPPWCSRSIIKRPR